MLQRHGVEFNALTCVTAANCDHPPEIYRFLVRIGSRHLQFIPVAERGPAAHPSVPGPAWRLPEPGPDPACAATPWSVQGEAWGGFLIVIFDHWVRHNVGEVYVQAFDDALAKWIGSPGGVCVHAEICDDMLAIEHDGSLYACDHYVYPEFRVGNILDRPLSVLPGASELERFGLDKRERLPFRCLRCPMLFACNGGCPKHRFVATVTGETGLNHLCAVYLAFLRHVDPYMAVMADLYRRGREPCEIRRLVKTWRAPCHTADHLRRGR